MIQQNLHKVFRCVLYESGMSAMNYGIMTNIKMGNGEHILGEMMDGETAGYRRRLIDARLERELEARPAVELYGITHAGKATSARVHAASVCDLAHDGDARDAARADPTLVIAGAEPRAILDCQAVPALEPAAEAYAEALASAGSNGALILTSSRAAATGGAVRAVAQTGLDIPTETPGATAVGDTGEANAPAPGGVARLRMYPLSLQELGISDASASLEGLLDGEIRASRFTAGTAPSVGGGIDTGMNACNASGTGYGLGAGYGLAGGAGRGTLTTPELARWCCRGGWPALNDFGFTQVAPNAVAGESESAIGATESEYGVTDNAFGLVDTARLAPDSAGCGEVVHGYVDEALADAAAAAGLSVATARALAWTLAVHLGEIPDASALASGMEAAAGANPARDTIRTYLRLLEASQLAIPVPGWVPPGRNRAHMRVKPRYYFADPSIPAALLSDTPEALLGRFRRLERLLENLVLRDLLVYLEAADSGARVSYYQESTGLAATFVVERGGLGERGYRWGAVRVCLSDAEADAAAKDLLKVRKRAKVPAPGFLAVVTGRGGYPVCRKDGVFVIPVASLGA